MCRRKYYHNLIFAAIGMFLLILDSKTAIEGAKSGIELCLYTVIPSLLPMLFLSIYLNSRLLGVKISPLASIGKPIGVPNGFESVLLIGILGGYPVGAQAVAQAYHAKSIDKSVAERILSFCNNAGPAFIFGITSSLFEHSTAVWALWLIHIISAYLSGVLLCNQISADYQGVQQSAPVSFPSSLSKSIVALANVCGWVTIFRVIICLLDRWILWLFPEWIRIVITGTLELTNGCVDLIALHNEGARFVLCGFFLSCGGLCVAMQTLSVISPLNPRNYFKGKSLQCAFTLLFSYIFQLLSFSPEQRFQIPPYYLLIPIIWILLFLFKNKKVVAKPLNVLYNANNR